MLATTKQMRTLVRSLVAVQTGSSWGSATWTDKCKSKRADVSNLRNIAFRLCEDEVTAIAKLKTAMFVLGYTNEVHVTSTQSDYFTRTTGGTYLRINKCVLEA
jgi:hypothetical protein